MVSERGYERSLATLQAAGVEVFCPWRLLRQTLAGYPAGSALQKPGRRGGTSPGGTLAPSLCEVAPAFAHLGTEPPPPRQAALFGRNGGVLGPGGRHSYSVVNEQAGPKAPASRADWQPDRPAASDVYGGTRQIVASPATEDRRGPAGLSRSLQNWEIIPETRGAQRCGGSLRPYIIRKGLLHRASEGGNEAERRRFGRHGDDVSLSTALSPYPAQCQLPCANVTFPGRLQSYPAQSNVLWPVATFPTPLQS
jgi:hypothetical protein